MTATSRRAPLSISRYPELSWERARGNIYDVLKRFWLGYSGIPGGFADTTPTTITVDGTADAGTEAASWMAANAQLIVASGTPVDLGEANAAGGASTVADSAHVHKLLVRVAKAGSTVGTRKRVNLIDGSGISITAVDDAGSDEIDVTIAAPSGSSRAFAFFMSGD